MKVKVGAGAPIELGATEAAPTIGIVDYSRRVTDDFGVTTVVERGFARRMSVRIGLPTEEVDSVQQLLADLRATEAEWIADDDIAWLQTTGFYKDFAVDLALPPLSYCTLAVEGLAESAAVVDGGEDPAPDGQTSTLQVLQPLEMTAAWLVAHNVPETDAPAWAIGTVYPLAYRVIRTSTHHIYESLIAGNTGHVPETSPAQWLDVGPTNRWAMFDQALGTATAAVSPIIVTIDAPGDNAIALLDVTADTVRVQATDYDRTELVGPGPVTFLDLPEAGGQVTVTVSGIGTLSIGTLLVGRVVGLGITEASPSAGITDFSRKEVDEFGEVSIVQRAWAKKMTARALIATEAVDLTADRIAAVRARPALWIADAALDSLIVYGFFRDFGIEIGETISKLSLSIEGLSKAQALQAPWAVDIAAIRAKVDRIASDGFLNAGEKPQAIIDRTAMLSNYNALNDRYLALGSPGDITASRDGAATKVTALGTYLTGLVPSWTDTTQDSPVVAALYEQRWVEAYEALAIFQAAVTGRTGSGGAAGLNNATVFAFRRAATSPAAPSATATYTFASGALTGLNNGWSSAVPAYDGNPLWVIAAVASGTGATDTIAAAEWSAPVIQAQDGDDGAPGANGLQSASVFLYQRIGSTPSVPSTTSTYTFASAVLSGHNNGWSQTIPANDGTPLWVTTAAAIATAPSATDTIASGEWATPQKLAENGLTGPAGSNNAILFAYQRSSGGAPALPTATATYTFSTKSLTGLNNGWSATVPGGTAPLYVTGASASSTTDTDAIGAGEWAAAQLLAASGTNGDPGAPGIGAATVFLLQRNDTGTPPSAPSVTTTYTFATAALAGVNNGWTQAAPDPSAGKYLFMTTATALGIGATDTIAAGEWAAVKQIVKDGDEGDPGPTGDPGPAGFTLSGGGSASVAATSGGTPKAGELPKSFTMKVMQGTVDRSDEGATTYAVTASSGCTAAMGGANGKVLSVSAMSADTASVTVTIYRSAVAIGTQEAKLSKARDGASVNGGRDDTLNAMPASGTDALLGSFALNVATGSTLSVAAYVQYFGNGAGSNTYGGQIRASYTVDGTETYGSYQSGDVTASDAEQAIATISGDPVYVNSSGVLKSVTVKLYGRRAFGTSGSSLTSGYVEASAS